VFQADNYIRIGIVIGGIRIQAEIVITVVRADIQVIIVIDVIGDFPMEIVESC